MCITCNHWENARNICIIILNVSMYLFYYILIRLKHNMRIYTSIRNTFISFYWYCFKQTRSKDYVTGLSFKIKLISILYFSLLSDERWVYLNILFWLCYLCFFMIIDHFHHGLVDSRCHWFHFSVFFTV